MDRNTFDKVITFVAHTSPPARVAWIETDKVGLRHRNKEVATREGGVDRNVSGMVFFAAVKKSPPARVAWIETYSGFTGTFESRRSPPARVAWIETPMVDGRRCFARVATREGGVDRNIRGNVRGVQDDAVATREGGVDRNKQSANVVQQYAVATREGGVDRNTCSPE